MVPPCRPNYLELALLEKRISTYVETGIRSSAINVNLQRTTFGDTQGEKFVTILSLKLCSSRLMSFTQSAALRDFVTGGARRGLLLSLSGPPVGGFRRQCTRNLVFDREPLMLT